MTKLRATYGLCVSLELFALLGAASVLSGCVGAETTTDDESGSASDDLRRRRACGDNRCNYGETCSSCAQDCGACEAPDMTKPAPPVQDMTMPPSAPPPASPPASPSPPDMAPPVSTGTLVFSASYQGTALPSDLIVQEAASDGITLAASPWNSAHKALRAIIRKGENWAGQGYPRSEVIPVTPTDTFTLAWHARYRYTSAFWVDAGAAFPAADFLAFFQLHGDDNLDATPPVAFVINGGKLDVILNRDGGYNTYVYGPCPTGQRVPFEVIFQPSTGADGYVKVTIGTTVVVERTGPNDYAAASIGGYFKQGLYDYDNNIAAQFIAFLDEPSIYKY